MKKIYTAAVKNAGIFDINLRPQTLNGFDVSGNLRSYQFDDLEKLVECAKRHDFVIRRDGSRELGIKYSIKKAKNDFRN